MQATPEVVNKVKLLRGAAEAMIDGYDKMGFPLQSLAMRVLVLDSTKELATLEAVPMVVKPKRVRVEDAMGWLVERFWSKAEAEKYVKNYTDLTGRKLVIKRR